MNEIMYKAQMAKEAARTLSLLSSNIKNQILSRMIANLDHHRGSILSANNTDLENGRINNLTGALIDRLKINEKRIEDMMDGLRVILDLPDPTGEIIKGWVRPNGLRISKKRVPIGVIGIIYEARPNVTVDAAALCVKSGNAVILRGSGSAINTNRVIVELLQKSAREAGVSEDIIQLIEDTGRDTALQMMKLDEYIDLLIPRGGAGLIRQVVENATVPVVETGVGNCHVFVDKEADLEKAFKIALNAKVHRPSVCNAAETLLVHKDVADEFLPGIFSAYKQHNVQIRGCLKSKSIDESIEIATEEDYATEFLDYIISVKVVESINEAIEHIHKYGTKHTEAIITDKITNARKFTDEVDAAVVMVNASTRFTDGGEFGFGAEMGISTQKLHARGPMGLQELTTIKYIVEGDGHIRG
jgi:glutamate-5-semialdehyde dehydrogenase